MKYVAVSPAVYINEAKDYYPLVQDFAKQVGLFMSCSNGVFKLGPTETSVQHYTETEAHKKEVEQFKLDHPEYKNAKGCKHKEPKEVKYGLHLKTDGSTKGSLRLVKLYRRLDYLVNYSPYRTECESFLNHLKKNHYRLLNSKKVATKFTSCSELTVVLLELDYLKETRKKGKSFIQLTEKGRAI